jgi:cellulose biosynthesis protein BcsQ
VKTFTFYSYKGGTGRSLLLANIAHYLARLGKRVVAVDFDFEAPGLHYKLNVNPATVPERGAVDYLLAAAQGEGPPKNLLDYLVQVPLPKGTTGSLHLMPAGSAPTGEYWKVLTALLRHDLFTNPEGSGLAAFLELKARIEESEELQTEFLLIDSRTGVTELAGVTTTVLADKVVCLMLANLESQMGARAVLRSLRHAPRLASQRPIEVIPVLSRVPERDEETVRETLSFLNAQGPTPEDTLTLERVFVLRTDPELAWGEKLHLGNGESQVRSPLHQDYLALIPELVETDPALAKLRRGSPGLDQKYAAGAGRLSGLQVNVVPDEDLDFVGLLPAFSSMERATADLALLMAGLSDIEIVNHDDKPTEILRLWLDLDGHPGPPPEIEEEDLTGSRRIEARSHRRFALRFAALFEGAPPQNWRQRVVLCVNATGFGQLRIFVDLPFSSTDLETDKQEKG